MVSTWVKLDHSLGDIGNLGVREVLTTGINCFLKSNRVEENLLLLILKCTDSVIFLSCLKIKNMRTSELTAFFSPVDKLETTKI